MLPDTTRATSDQRVPNLLCGPCASADVAAISPRAESGGASVTRSRSWKRVLRTPHEATWRHLVGVTVAGMLVLAFGPTVGTSAASTGLASNWIVTDLDGTDAGLATQIVASVGGQLVQPLAAADSVEASLTAAQAWALELI